MNKADVLTPALRQVPLGKAGGKGGLHGAVQAKDGKDGKDKADQFLDQLKLLAKEPKAAPVAKPEAETVATPAKILDAASVLAELTSAAKADLDGEDDRKHEAEPQDASNGEKPLPGWSAPGAALSAVMSRLDRGHQGAARDKSAVATSGTPDAELKIDDGMLDAAMKPQVAAAGESDADPSGQRFALTVETADTKALPAMKAVVRDQETHFEPVQQPTTLQKIVDRMAADLSVAAPTDAAPATDAQAADINKAADSRPVRIMTLQLDPPNLGAVTVRMRLAGDAVEIRLTADSYETTQMLRQERGALSDAMQSAGYSFDIASIDHTRTADANLNNGQQQASSDQRSSLPSSNGQQGDGSASDRPSRDAQDGARHNRQDHEEPSKSPERKQDKNGNGIRSSTVYL